jgi:hypothetical protein
MKTKDSAEILEVVGNSLFNQVNKLNDGDNYSLESPPKQPVNDNYDIGSFMVIRKSDGKRFACSITVRELV